MVRQFQASRHSCTKHGSVLRCLDGIRAEIRQPSCVYCRERRNQTPVFWTLNSNWIMGLFSTFHHLSFWMNAELFQSFISWLFFELACMVIWLQCLIDFGSEELITFDGSLLFLNPTGCFSTWIHTVAYEIIHLLLRCKQVLILITSRWSQL
jgi:hypothetical protein